MRIEHGPWRFEPYGGKGSLCWQVKHRTSGGRWPHEGMRFYDSLGRAFRFAAEYSLRNDEDTETATTLADALDRYERITDGFKALFAGGRQP